MTRVKRKLFGGTWQNGNPDELEYRLEEINEDETESVHVFYDKDKRIVREVFLLAEDGNLYFDNRTIHHTHASLTNLVNAANQKCGTVPSDVVELLLNEIKIRDNKLYSGS